MDILDDMGVSKLSAKVFSKVNYSIYTNKLYSDKLIKLNLTISFSHVIYCVSHYEGKVDANAVSC